MRNLTLVFICLLLVFGKTQAQLTALDTSFNHIGYLVNPALLQTGYHNHEAEDFAVQGDGSIITITTESSISNIFFMRYKQDGSIDNSFKLSIVPVLGAWPGLARLHMLPDDRFWLYCKSVSQDSLMLFRFLPDGTPDSSFDNDGIRKYRFAHPQPLAVNYPVCFGVQPDGKVLMGTRWNGVHQLLRVDSTGKIDSTFSADGFAWFHNYPTIGYTAADLHFQQGRILCVGDEQVSTVEEKYSVFAFKYNGEPDSSFGINGYNSVALGYNTVFKTSRMQRDGKLIMSGAWEGGLSRDITMVRLKENGIVDSTFGTTGTGIERTSVLTNSWDEAGSIELDANDGLWVIADKYNPFSSPAYEHMVIRYTKDGKVDSLYHTHGRIPFVTGSTHSTILCTKMVKDKVLVYGNGFGSGMSHQFVARIFLRPVIDLQQDTIVCENDTVTLSTGSSFTHAWYRNDTLLSYTGNKLKATQAGTYKVVLSVGSASDSSDKMTLLFHPRPAKPMLTGTDSLCEGDTLSLQASTTTNGITWNWMTPAGNLVNAGPAITVDSVIQADTGLYRVVALFDGCTSEEDSLQVVVHPVVIPSLTVTADKINPGPWVDVQFSATAITNAGSTPTYQWTKNGTDIPGANSITYTATTAIALQSGDEICIKLTGSEACTRPGMVSDCETVNIDLAVPNTPFTGQLIIYPNPTEGHLTIKTDSKGVWHLTNIQGQVVMKMEINKGVNDIVIPASIADGTYILHTGLATAQLVIKR